MKNFVYLILVMTMVFANSANVLAENIEYASPQQNDAVREQAPDVDYGLKPEDLTEMIEDDELEAQYESQVITQLEYKICDMKLKLCLLEAENFSDKLICYNLYSDCLERHEEDESE